MMNGECVKVEQMDGLRGAGTRSTTETAMAKEDESVRPVAAMSREELEVEVQELRAAAAMRLKKDEQEVELQKNLLRSVGQAIICTDLQGTITYWNRAATTMYQWSEEEALGQNVMDILRPASVPIEELGKELMTQLCQGKQWTGEYSVYTRDNEFLEILVVDTPIMDSNGQLVGIIGVSTDITDLKRKEAQILQLNAELEERVAQRTKELESTNAQLRLEADEHRRAKDRLQLLYTQKEAFQQKIEKQANYLETLVEELRAARREAESASALKSRFLAHMSHEIRTPLNGVMGMTSLLLYTQLSAEQEGYVQTIKTSSDLLLAILNDILDLSKIEAGELVLEYITFSFRRSLEGTIDIFAMKAREGGLELVCRVDPSVPELIHTDPTRLQQVIMNLISNAIKFTPSGGFVDVSARAEPWVGPPACPEEGQPVMRLHVAVRDSGIGIPPSRCHRLFKPFSQIDVSTTRKFGGTGLGLAISKQLVENLGGEISVESAGTGHGCTFKFSVALYMPRPVRCESAHEAIMAALAEGPPADLIQTPHERENGLDSKSAWPQEAPTAGVLPGGTASPELPPFTLKAPLSSASNLGIPAIAVIVRHAVVQSAVVDEVRHVGVHPVIISWDAMFNCQNGAATPPISGQDLPPGGMAALVSKAWKYDVATEADELQGNADTCEGEKTEGKGTCVLGVVMEIELSAPCTADLVAWFAWLRRRLAKEYAKQVGGAFTFVERLSLVLLVGGSVRMTNESRLAAADLGLVADLAKPIRQSQLIRALQAVARGVPKTGPANETQAKPQRKDITESARPPPLSKFQEAWAETMELRPQEPALSTNAFGFGIRERELERARSDVPRRKDLARAQSDVVVRMSGDLGKEGATGKSTLEAGKTVREAREVVGARGTADFTIGGGSRSMGHDHLCTSDANGKDKPLEDAEIGDGGQGTRNRGGGSDTRIERARLLLAASANGSAPESAGASASATTTATATATAPATATATATGSTTATGRATDIASSAAPLTPKGHRSKQARTSESDSSVTIMGNDSLDSKWPIISTQSELQPVVSAAEAEEGLVSSARSMSLDLPPSASETLKDKEKSHLDDAGTTISTPAKRSIQNPAPRFGQSFSLTSTQTFELPSDSEKPSIPPPSGQSLARANSQPPSRAAKLGETHPLKILLVEDNPVNQKVARSLLQVLGYPVDHVWNGQEALEALRQQSYDLVFMDVQMPVMDGIEATRNILLEWPPQQRPRVVAMTANVLNTDKQKCLSAGMEAFVSKPIRVSDLILQLQKTKRR